MIHDSPHDDDAEQVLLGTCIIMENALPLRDLNPSLFYRTNNRLIAAEIAAMAKSGEPVTTNRLTARLWNRVLPTYVSSLTDGIPIYRNWNARELSFYRQRVIQYAEYRRGAAASYELSEAYLSGDPGQIMEALQKLQKISTRQGSGPGGPATHAVSAKEFLAMNIKPRAMLLDPIIPEQGLAMIYSRRGVGKTHLALGIAVAVASGGNFLRWTAQSQNSVLYIDGELPSALLQEWIAETVLSIGADAVGENLQIITPDLQDLGIPDLSTVEGQSAIEPHVRDAKLIIVDNLSALCRTGAENEAECWLPLQHWALEQRRSGKSVLFVHHAGHQGKNQRGTSKREDLLDSVIALRHPPDYNPADGLRAEVHLEKARHFHGEQAKSFTVSIKHSESGGSQWITRNLNETQFEKACRMFIEGLDVDDVREDLKVSRSTAFRFQKRFRESQVSPSTPRDYETAGEGTNDSQY